MWFNPFNFLTVFFFGAVQKFFFPIFLCRIPCLQQRADRSIVSLGAWGHLSFIPRSLVSRILLSHQGNLLAFDGWLGGNHLPGLHSFLYGHSWPLPVPMPRESSLKVLHILPISSYLSGPFSSPPCPCCLSYKFWCSPTSIHAMSTGLLYGGLSITH